MNGKRFAYYRFMHNSPLWQMESQRRELRRQFKKLIIEIGDALYFPKVLVFLSKHISRGDTEQ